MWPQRGEEAAEPGLPNQLIEAGYRYFKLYKVDLRVVPQRYRSNYTLLQKPLC